MPKNSTFPTLYNECKTVSIFDLKRWGYLSPDLCNSGVITWSRNGNKTGSISIEVNTYNENYFIVLDYKSNDVPIKYTVQLVSIPSNLGRGVIWYFVCPKTGKRCRKLYLVNSYFFHRSAFNGMYEKQTYSHNNRNSIKSLEVYFGMDKMFDILYSKYFKKFYSGKPTKRYKRIMDQLKKVESYTPEQYERLLIN